MTSSYQYVLLITKKEMKSFEIYTHLLSLHLEQSQSINALIKWSCVTRVFCFSLSNRYVNKKSARVIVSWLFALRVVCFTSDAQRCVARPDAAFTVCNLRLFSRWKLLRRLDVTRSFI